MIEKEELYLFYPKNRIGWLEYSRHKYPDFIASLSCEQINERYEVYCANPNTLTLNTVQYNPKKNQEDEIHDNWLKNIITNPKRRKKNEINEKN